MENLVIPKSYTPDLDVIKTQIAIKLIKDFFENKLAEELNLIRVSAPLFVKKSTGLNDNLSGIEKPVSFNIQSGETEEQFEIVQSLAKWKRVALHKYNFKENTGLYTDMNAIRPSETLDNIHSLYVDQWDWEKVISEKDRNLTFLHDTIKKIYKVFLMTEDLLLTSYPNHKKLLPENLFILSSQELEDALPENTPEEREKIISKDKRAVFITHIGGKLNSGISHGNRAPDYDDWNLNGDLIFYNPVLEDCIEISSMGIRVNPETLLNQLKISNHEERKELPYHKMLISKKLPQTIGGGIGQSRMCMFFLQKAHIGEVQSSYWSEEILKRCENSNIKIL